MIILTPDHMMHTPQGLHHILKSHMYVAMYIFRIILIMCIVVVMMSIAWCVTMVIITSSYAITLPWLPSIIGAWGCAIRIPRLSR